MSTCTCEFMAYYTALCHRHQQFEFQSRKLFQELEKQMPKPTLILVLMKSLRTNLEEHFEMNREEGHLDEAISRRPILGKAADRLQLEYRLLICQIDHLISLLPSTEAPPLPRTFLIAFEDFARRLDEIKSAEVELLEYGFNTFIH